ncbi:hypothetical protein DPM18_03240 [Polynucleobacter paneuropaeus]|uniref:tetratricopeptide repeat protein n=1 Tax=Polynucleobacter paneuropaeus TaxID=2527775 RepID=UPI000DBF1B45|nr:tetratricopeptide repeat protein [Polynucleobacter paneuropaeus]AWW45912.1 hypothetical protein DPM18_03240 [Polynucleobacter paneuropaeus]
MTDIKKLILITSLFMLFGCDRLKNFNIKSTEANDKVCEKAFADKTDEQFGKCLSVADSTSGVIQYGISEIYSLGLYAPYHRDKDGLISDLNPKNNEERVKWLKKSADNKNPFVASAYQLGEAYYYGRSDMNISKDYTKAIYYYKIASKLGAPYATGQLASMYSEGIGVPKDYYKSYIFNNIALSQCDDKYLEKYRLAVIEDMNDNERKLDKKLINQSQKVASECVESKFTKCEVY